jgi:uncharacterized protein YdeI (YjbR/CyaY-like superfamily)
VSAESAAERHPEDGWPVVPFRDQRAFEDWLTKICNGDSGAGAAAGTGLWVKFAKKKSGIASITMPQALEASACFGWVDSKMQRYDEDHYILRYQPRKARSAWSPRNAALAERLIAEGRMRPSGLAQVEAARADGRWPA